MYKQFDKKNGTKCTKKGGGGKICSEEKKDIG